MTLQLATQTTYTHIQIRKLDMLVNAIKIANEARLERNSKILCDARASLNKLRWKRSIQQVIVVKRIVGKTKNTQEQHNVSEKEFEKNLKDAEALNTVDARVAAIREVLFLEDGADKTSHFYRDALKRLQHYEHEIEVRDNLVAKLRGAMSTILFFSLDVIAHAHTLTHTLRIL